MAERKEISRRLKNGDCINGERHSWRIEYGDAERVGKIIIQVDTHICIKCGEKKFITHRDLFGGYYGRNKTNN